MDFEHIQRDLDELGYSVISPFLDSEQLEALRMECEILRELALEGRQASPWGADAQSSCIFETLPGTLCNANPDLRTHPTAYKSARSTWPLQSSVWSLLFASRLTNLALTLLGPETVLFNEQYIVKPPRGGAASSFRWHRDSDWCREGSVRVDKSLSIWVALDDMTEQNGCFVVRPRSHKTAPPMGLESTGNLKIDPMNALETDGAHGASISQAATIPLLLPAGSAVVTSDMVEHASGPNTTQYARRAWMPQFSSQPIVWKENGKAVSLAIPLK